MMTGVQHTINELLTEQTTEDVLKMASSVLSPALQAIIDAPLPSVRNPNLRGWPRKERAKQIRGLFRDFGLKGIGATTPTHSMAQSIDIRIPGAATERIHAILLAAFPDLDDRSDSRTDYFNYCLLVTAARADY